MLSYLESQTAYRHTRMIKEVSLLYFPTGPIKIPIKK
jgi:hypothetical protein